MMFNTYIINSPQPVLRTFQQQVQELCDGAEPKPLYCELPDDLKLRNLEVSVTTQIYTYSSSITSLAAIGTSAMTTS